jgi:hypothetical protein
VGTEVRSSKAAERFDAQGMLTDPVLRGQLAELVFA